MELDPEKKERKKSGPKPGSKRLSTLRKEAVAQEMRERVMKHVDPLFNAQLSRAVGSVRIFRVDEAEDGKGNMKREHVLVTDPDEMKRVLDGNDGTSGIVGESYYFVTEIPPDNKAIDSMLDRTFGKAPQSIAVTTDPDALEMARELVRALIEEDKMKPDVALKLTAKRYNLPEGQLALNAAN